MLQATGKRRGGGGGGGEIWTWDMDALADILNRIHHEFQERDLQQ
jgi:hypothetical protein